MSFADAPIQTHAIRWMDRRSHWFSGPPWSRCDGPIRSRQGTADSCKPAVEFASIFLRQRPPQFRYSGKTCSFSKGFVDAALPAGSIRAKGCKDVRIKSVCSPNFRHFRLRSAAAHRALANLACHSGVLKSGRSSSEPVCVVFLFTGAGLSRTDDAASTATQSPRHDPSALIQARARQRRVDGPEDACPRSTASDLPPEPEPATTRRTGPCGPAMF